MYNTTNQLAQALNQRLVHFRLLAEAVPLMVPTAVPLQDSTGSQLFVLAADRLPGGKLEQESILSMSYTATCCGDDIGIGGVYAAALSCTVNGTLSLLDMKIRAEIGAEVDGSVEWLPLGTFVVTDCRRSDDHTEFTAYDGAYYALGGAYAPTVRSGSTVAAVLEDLAEQCGLTVEQSTLDMGTMRVDGDLSGHTCREMLGYLAALCGKNAVVTREGAIRFVWFAKFGEEVTPDNYYSGELSNGGAAKLAGLTCTVPGEDEDSREGQTLTAGDSTLAVTVECPYMTQSRLDFIWSEVGGYAYPMADIGYYGGALTEPGDIVKVTNREGVTISVPVMQVQLSMDGGCKCQISAFGQADTSKVSGRVGPIQRQMQQVLKGIAEGIYDGKDGVPGKDGKDGESSYVHIKYAPVANPTDAQMTETPSDYIGICTDHNLADPATASSYTWSRFTGQDGEDGTPGKDGTNGKDVYVHFAYALSADGTEGFSVKSFSGALYIGVRTDNTQADSTNPADYSWSRFKGEQGQQGLQGLQGPQGEQGIQGENGLTSYFHVKYSAKENPTSASDMSETPNVYIGTYVDFTAADSTDPQKYTWHRFQGLQGEKGDQGIPGVGTDGKTSYLHIKYSDDGGKTFTANSGETPGSYIGQYTDFTQADSTSVSKYTWSKIQGDTGPQGPQGEQGNKGDTGISVESVTRYYQLADTAPTKPTTKTPSSAWTTTEPGYAEDNPDHLYLVDRTIYEDETYQYSDVSLSSSYEASKAAYQRAQEAQEAADAAAEDAAEALEAANGAMTSANGKNKVFHQSTAPTTSDGLTAGDIWFDTGNDNRINTWTGSAWSAFELGENAIANLSITNAKIADATIQSAKIANLDAGKLTTGTLDSDRINTDTLFAKEIIATGSITGAVLKTGDNFSVDKYGNLEATNATVNRNLYLYDSINDITYTIEADGGLGTNSDFHVGEDLYVGGDAHGLDGIFTIKAQSISIPDVSPGIPESGTLGVSISGYKPIGIAGWTTGTATGNSLFSVPRLYLDGTTCHYLVRNMHASDSYSCTLTVYVLYVAY